MVDDVENLRFAVEHGLGCPLDQLTFDQREDVAARLRDVVGSLPADGPERQLAERLLDVADMLESE